MSACSLGDSDACFGSKVGLLAFFPRTLHFTLSRAATKGIHSVKLYV